MLDVDLDTLRLFLHILAATIWVGGQLTLAALVPVLRRAAPDSPKLAARQFNNVAWPAYVVLLVTGFWNVIAEDDHLDDAAYNSTLGVKMTLVLLSGVTAFLHSRAKTKRGLAVNGALTAVTALGALFFGVVLSGGH